MNLDTPLKELDWISPQRVRQLERFGLATVGDLLTHFPRRYEDRSRFDRFPTGASDQAVCVCGIVRKTSVKRVRGSQTMFDVVLEEPEAHALSGLLLCRWFNAHWVEKMLVSGQRLVVYGKPKRSGPQVIITHPEFEVVEEEEKGPSVHLQRITPVHKATEGLSARVLRGIIWDTLERLGDESLEELLPQGLDPVSRGQALRQIHFPPDWDAMGQARRHLVLTEFFALQLCVAAKRSAIRTQLGEAHCGPGHLMEQLHEGLPFELTGAQKRAIAEIRADLQAPRPMNRLLHGDVGSGKTLVALSAMLLAVEAGYQAALMAPTQILAEQHYFNFKRLLDPLGLGIALRTGSRKEDTGTLPLFAHAEMVSTGTGSVPQGGSLQPCEDLRTVPDRGDLPQNPGAPSAGRPKAPALAGGEPQIFVGTHALLYEGAGISRLGLAIIDEQHKFGVLQRARLRDQGLAPDVLVMTATPIPRTLTMTVFGDLDVSTLDEMPADRGKIITAARPSTKLPEAVDFIRQHLEKGRQAYVVYPLIDESEKLEAKAAVAEFEKWQRLLAPLRCELLHGRVPPEEKDSIMERFRAGETKVLIATTVIEVGIDVPNANIMLIENADRFGLAQLHQLRGRIGRGTHKSYCILLTAKGPEDEVAADKLRILSETLNGFEIAEADLRLRGPGDILGTAQSGLPPLKLGDVLADADLMQLARQYALALMEADPGLQSEPNRGFKALLAHGLKLTLAQVS